MASKKIVKKKASKFTWHDIFFPSLIVVGLLGCLVCAWTSNLDDKLNDMSRSTRGAYGQLYELIKDMNNHNACPMQINDRVTRLELRLAEASLRGAR